jgi:hypothetical protein
MLTENEINDKYSNSQLSELHQESPSLPVISSPVKYLHFGGGKAEGRRQKAKGTRQRVQREDNCLGRHDIRR